MKKKKHLQNVGSLSQYGRSDEDLLCSHGRQSQQLLEKGKGKEAYLYSAFYILYSSLFTIMVEIRTNKTNYVYLKALRHGSHSFTCKYTMPAFPSYAFTRWRHP